MHDPTHQDKARSINRFRAAEFLRRLTTQLLGMTGFLEAAEACEVVDRLTLGAHAVHHGRRVGIAQCHAAQHHLPVWDLQGFSQKARVKGPRHLRTGIQASCVGRQH